MMKLTLKNVWIGYLLLLTGSSLTQIVKEWLDIGYHWEWHDYFTAPFYGLALWFLYDRWRGRKEKKPAPEIIKEPRRITLSDIFEYHDDKAECNTCEMGEWDCPQHPFNRHNEPRYKTAVDDGFRPALLIVRRLQRRRQK